MRKASLNLEQMLVGVIQCRLENWEPRVLVQVLRIQRLIGWLGINSRWRKERLRVGGEEFFDSERGSSVRHPVSERCG